MYTRLFLLLACIILACKSDTGSSHLLDINRDEESFVMVEVETDAPVKDLLNALRAINAAEKYRDKRMSSTSLNSATGARTFMIVRGFGNFAAAEEYVSVLENQKVAGNPFSIPATQYKECMQARDFEQYRAAYRKARK
jgi:hypothetical protein